MQLLPDHIVFCEFTRGTDKVVVSELSEAAVRVKDECVILTKCTFNFWSNTELQSQVEVVGPSLDSLTICSVFLAEAQHGVPKERGRTVNITTRAALVLHLILMKNNELTLLLWSKSEKFCFPLRGRAAVRRAAKVQSTSRSDIQD